MSYYMCSERSTLQRHVITETRERLTKHAVTKPLPRVGVVYSSDASAGPRDVLIAAADLCEPVFLIDPRDESIAGLADVLTAHGDIIDFTQGIDDPASAEVAELAAITTFSERSILSTARLAEALGLGYHTVAVAQRLTDKYLQRQTLNAAGVGCVVPVVRVASRDEVLAAVEQLGVPCIIKPIAGAGSRAVLRLDLSGGNARDVDLVLSSCGDGQVFLVESLITGEQHPAGSWLSDFVSVESVSFHGYVAHLCVTDRLSLTWPFRERGSLLPSALPAELSESVMRTAGAALAALGVEVGVTHTEIKLTDPRPTVVEVNGRLGGHIARLMRRTYKFDPVRAELQASLGRQVECKIAQQSGFAACFAPQAPAAATRVLSLPTPREIRSIAGVAQVFRLANEGDLVSWVNGYSDRLYDVVIDGATLSAVERTITTVDKLFEHSAEFAYTS